MSLLVKNAIVVNEDIIAKKDILIEGEFISEIYESGTCKEKHPELNAEGLYLFPGLIDDQVHFREPGLTNKGEIFTESAAAVAGGITSFMEMPNTKPSAITQNLLKDKYAIAADKSLANYSFYMGTSNTNLNEVLNTNPRDVCGIKIFMGSSTGDMLVNNPESLEAIFRECKLLIATHCEDDPMIKSKMEWFKSQFGDNLKAIHHPLIRSREACYKSSSYAVSLAEKYNTRLHILHISTKEELSLFRNDIPLNEKRITSEACIHHLWFSDEDYEAKGNFIKWNPAVKTSVDREAIMSAVNDNRIDVIATDHAPHTLEEKNASYIDAPSGGPLVQHALQALIDLYFQNKISLNTIVRKTSHSVADMFAIEKRGYIRKGYYADFVLVNLNKTYEVNKQNILYKCKWSPFEGHKFKSTIEHTFINGNHVYRLGELNLNHRGKRLLFNRS